MIVFVGLAFLGVPIAAALGLSSIFSAVFVMDIPLSMIAQRIFSGIDSFSLMAIPLFVVAGNAMNYGGITKKIVDFANCFVGSYKGGLAQINVLSSMLFGGMSGSAVADTSSIGGILIPSMKKEGYEAGFSASITAFSSGLGPIIPPSITMVVYGIITGVSITKLFVGGAVPGLLFGFGLMIAVSIIASKKNYPRHEKSTWKQKLNSLKDVGWAILMPVVVVGSILFGISTVTEAAAIAAVYSLFVGIFIYKGIKSIEDVYNILKDSLILISSVMILIGAAKLFSYMLIVAQVPMIVSNMIFSLTSNKWIVLLLINLFMLVIGMFVEANAALLIFVPILFPLCVDLGIDPVHLGIILVFNLCLGVVTPPVGLCLNLASKIANCSLQESVGASKPFFIVGFVILLLMTYVPPVVLFLPGLLN